MNKNFHHGLIISRLQQLQQNLQAIMMQKAASGTRDGGDRESARGTKEDGRRRTNIQERWSSLNQGQEDRDY